MLPDFPHCGKMGALPPWSLTLVGSPGGSRMAVRWLEMLSGLAPAEGGELRVQNVGGWVCGPGPYRLAQGKAAGQVFNPARNNYWKQLPPQRGW